MPHQVYANAQLAFLVMLLLGILGGLARYGTTLRDDLKAGLSLSRGKASPPPAVSFEDPLAGVTVQAPAGVSVLVSGAGVLLKKDQDAMKAAIVCPIVADRSIAPSEVLTAVHRSWAAGMKESNELLTIGTLHDEGAIVRASLESGRGADAVYGEMRVVRTAPGLRFEAFWTTKDEYDRERAMLDSLTRTVKLTPGQPMPIEVGTRHRAGVPAGYNFVEDQGGIEVIARSDVRVAYGLATGTGHGGLENSEALIATYIDGSKGLTNPTTGIVRAYPTVEYPKGQVWDITARDMEYDADGQRVRAIVTAALTGGTLGDAFLLSVRQAPPDQWDKLGYQLTAIESTARFMPKGLKGPALGLPLSHLETTWELVESWEIGRASRKPGTRWREAMLPLEERLSPATERLWGIPIWLSQPDGTYLNPENPLETLVVPAP